MGFEIVEQLGWRYPKHVVSPVAGGTLLPRILRGFRELQEIGLVEGDLPHDPRGAGGRLRAGRQRARRGPRASGAGAARTRSPSRSRSAIRPTAFRCSKRCASTGGAGAAVSRRADRRRDSAARRNRRHLHRAGRRHDAGRDDRSRSRRGVIDRDESVVVCVTGNGYKTAEVMAGPAAAAGEPGPRVQGIRSVVRRRGRRRRRRGVKR